MQTAAAIANGSSTLSSKKSATFTEEDRILLQKLKLQQRQAEPPQATHAVETGSQMQFTASSYSQEYGQGGLNQKNVTKRILALEARQARSEGVLVGHMTETGLLAEDVQSDIQMIREEHKLELLKQQERLVIQEKQIAHLLRQQKNEATIPVEKKQSSVKNCVISWGLEPIFIYT